MARSVQPHRRRHRLRPIAALLPPRARVACAAKEAALRQRQTNREPTRTRAAIHAAALVTLALTLLTAPAFAHHRSSAGRIDAFTTSTANRGADADATALAVTLGSSYGRYDRWLAPAATTTAPGTLGRLVGELGLQLDAGARLGAWLRLPLGLVRLTAADGTRRDATGIGDLQLGLRLGLHRDFDVVLGGSLPTGSRSAGQVLQQTQLLRARAADGAAGETDSVLFRSQTDANLGAGAPGLWLGARGRRALGAGVAAQVGAGWRGFLGEAADGWAWGQDWTADAGLAWQSAGGALGLNLGLGVLEHRADRARSGARYGARRELSVQAGLDLAGPGRSRCALTTRLPVGQWADDPLLAATVEISVRCRVEVARRAAPRGVSRPAGSAPASAAASADAAPAAAQPR